MYGYWWNNGDANECSIVDEELNAGCCQVFWFFERLWWTIMR
jgi:hypothetical protein